MPAGSSSFRFFWRLFSLPFLCLRLGDVLNLFLYRGEQMEQREVRLRRRRNGRLFARRFILLLIYL